MSLHLHRAERADRLVDALADVLAQPLADSFASEVVCVPTQGVERWLAQRLSHRLGTSPGGRDGICAGVWFPSLRRLVATATAGSGSDDADPWRPDRAVWPVLAVIEEARGEAWAALLWSYLAGRSDSDPGEWWSGRRWRTARQLAELFVHYADSRPTMIDHWSAGRDLDALGVPLPPDRAWQAELWRRVRHRLGARSPVERLAEAVRRLRDDPAAADLPARVSVFGATRLDTGSQQVLVALAEHRDVHLWLPHASPALWDAIAEDLDRHPVPLGPRAADPTADRARHPLLAYLGRDSRELQITLGARAGRAGLDRHYQGTAIPKVDVLHRLQADLTANADGSDPKDRPVLDQDDRSVQVHSCYGPDRQVEVLREVLVGLLADDPTLEPRDIVVLCPDIERFAPLISAAFGLQRPEGTGAVSAAEGSQPEHPGHRLRVRLADRALRQLNPLLSVLSQVFDLADSRVTASSLLDLAGRPPVARRFGFSEDDTGRLAALVAQSGVRWGLDAAHRRPYGLETFGQNTWSAGLDRLLLGVTMDADGDHFIGTALPLDDVDSSDVDLVGRLAELVERVRRLVDAASRRQTLAEWLALSRTVIEALTVTPASEAWQVGHAYGELARLGEAATEIADAQMKDRIEAGTQIELGLAEIRALLEDTFRGRASRANFRTGTLTMCTMHPMRSVPHRVVCLLGVDDGVFPRRPPPTGDDILATSEWIGDRDPRSEDRQLLLDAIMAAESTLVVIYSGADPRTGKPRPPAVPIGELLDALDRTVTSPDERRVRDHLTIRHSLQPFDRVNFASAAGQPPLSFDPTALRGAQAAERPPRPARTAYETGPLPALDLDPVIALNDLTRFFAHPARTLLRARGGLVVGAGGDNRATDQLAVDLDSLESWEIGERLLERHLRGAPLERLRAAEWRRGSLPPRRFGENVLAQVLRGVQEVADLARPHVEGPPRTLDVLVDLMSTAGACAVAGTLQPVYGDTLLRVGYSRLSARHRLTSWIDLLALTADRPEERWRAVTVGRGDVSILGPLDPDWAGRVLADLLELYATGLREAVPFAPKTSAHYADTCHRHRSPEVYKPRIALTWSQERDAIWSRFYGAELDDLMAQPSRTSEERGTLAEPTLFGTLARRVFYPLLDHEELG